MISNSRGAFSTFPTCGELAGPGGVIRIALGGQTNSHNWQEMVYNKEKLLQLGGTHQDQIRKWKRKAEEAVEQGITP